MPTASTRVRTTDAAAQPARPQRQLRSRKRQFTVSPHIIYSLIKAQAGSLGKAVLECVMNSVDAGATQVDIRMTPTTIQIVDNGKGFASLEEIETCFDVFGFEHDEGSRTYGQFGIGRAQLWNFCTTLWRTNTFSMDVDIKKKGLDYDLREGLPMEPGLTIKGSFYTRQSTKDILVFEKEIAELARYAQCELTVNGTRVDQDPAKERWTHETPDAWVRLKETGLLTVYNLGVKVKDYPGYTFGGGGVVVTKPGVRLSLNMARNDILVTECKVWKRIKPFLQNEADKAASKKSVRMTEEQIANLIERAVAGEVGLADIEKRKLLMDIQGKQWTLRQFFDRARQPGQMLTVAPRGTSAAEVAHRLNYGIVLAPITLTRFGVDTVKGFHERLLTIMAFKDATSRYESYDTQKVKALVVTEQHTDVSRLVNDRFETVADKDTTPHERALLKALSATQRKLLDAMKAAGVVDNEEQFKARSLHAGESEVARGWTFPALTSTGRGRIVLERRVLDNARYGLSGILSIAHLMAHEYLHEGDDTVTHEHDLEFYERYHDAMNGGSAAVMFGDFVMAAYRAYLSELRRAKLKILSQNLRDVDVFDQEHDLAEPLNDGSVDDAQAA